MQRGQRLAMSDAGCQTWTAGLENTLAESFTFSGATFMKTSRVDVAVVKGQFPSVLRHQEVEKEGTQGSAPDNALKQ